MSLGVSRCSKLMDLSSELEEASKVSSNQTIDPPVLFSMEVMAHPLELRFKYHFSGDKPTNKLDRVILLTFALNHEHEELTRSSLNTSCFILRT